MAKAEQPRTSRQTGSSTRPPNQHDRRNSPLRRPELRSDSGATLLEILIAIVIIGIIAAIAVVSLIGQKKKSYDTSVQSDMANIAKAENDYVLAHGGSYLNGTADVNILIANGAAFSGGNKFSIAFTDNGFCLQGSNKNGRATGTGSGGYIWYDSQNGGIQPGRPTSPPSGGVCAAVNSSAWVVMTDGNGGYMAAAAPSTAPTAAPGTPAGTTGPTVTPPPNDNCPTGVELDQPTVDHARTSTGDTTNVGATDNSSVWYHTYAPSQVYLTYAVTDPSTATLTGNRTLEVFQGPTTPTNGGATNCPANLTAIGASTGTRPGVSFRSGSSGNSNYYIKVSSPVGSESKFKLDLWKHSTEVPRDAYAKADTMSTDFGDPTIINNSLQTTLWGTIEPGEDKPAGTSTVWHVLETGGGRGSPNYTITTLPPTGSVKPIGRHTIEVYADGVGPDNPGELLGSETGVGSVSINVDTPRDGQVYVRISSDTGAESGSYQIQLERVS